MRKLLIGSVLLLISCASAAGAKGTQSAAAEEDEVKRVAETYLKATTGEGDESGKDLLLGGATGNAQLFTLENWSIVEREPVRREQGELSDVQQMMKQIDEAGREALSQFANGGESGDSVSVTIMDSAEASRLLGPTKEAANRFISAHPVLAYVTRVGKEVYWHPKNPMRGLLSDTGFNGQYTVDMYLWKVQSKEGPRASPRVWPLRVVRFKAGKIDTGWKVLPASDWNAE
jgi:hypothetical protein